MKLILCFGVLLGVAWSLETFEGHQVLRMKPRNEEQIELLKELGGLKHLQLNFWRSPSHPKEPVDLQVPFACLQAVKVFLESHRIEYSILIEDVQALLDEESREMHLNRQRESGSSRDFNYGAYHNLDTIYRAMDDIAAEHPEIVSKLQIGETYENRPLFVLKFSTRGSRRPAVWIDAGIHAREWVTQATALWTAKKIASDFGKDPSLTSPLKHK
ncbi:PREDICTED: carboxypeptidase A2-like, partial [Thamnophis sirtalis]|uniref:Carboxypeptidase A2-like n=1 Tax=Thamnophis sirtalis TaxID=35019 RepID=A0A6I9Z263_9SAUR